MTFKDNIVFQVIYIQPWLKKVYQRLFSKALFVLYVVRRLPSTTKELCCSVKVLRFVDWLVTSTVFLVGTSFKNFHSRKSDSLFTLSRTVKSLTGNEGPSVTTFHHTVVRHFKTLLRSIGSSRMKGEPKSWALLWPREGFQAVMVTWSLDTNAVTLICPFLTI